MKSLEFNGLKAEVESCPTCKSDSLVAGTWHMDHGEVDAVECNSCHTGAPLESWNNRPEREFVELFDFLFNAYGAVVARNAVALARKELTETKI